MLAFDISEEQAAGHVAGLVGRFVVDPGSEGPRGRFASAVATLGRRLANPHTTVLRWPILSPEEWIRDRYYTGPLTDRWWPKKYEWFIRAANGDVTEVHLTGAIGIGKTECLKALCLYDRYRLSCFENPQAALGIGQAEAMIMLLISLSVTKSAAKLFEPISRIVRATPYFQEHCKPDPRLESKLVFPDNVVIRPGVTGESAIHSEDVIALYCTEVNFYPVVTDSKRKRGIEELDVAADLLDAVLRRMETRFMRQGKLPLCRIGLDSSRQFPDDFLERRTLAAARGEIAHRTALIDASIWEAKAGALDSGGRPYYSGETFPVEVGDKNRYSRILNDDEVPYARGEVIQVPEEHRSGFEADIEGSLRDYAGRAVLSLRLLVPSREAIHACIRTPEHGYLSQTCKHPFSAPTTTLRDGVRLIEDRLFDPETNRLWVNHDHPRTVHIDVGLTADSLGIGIAHVEEMVTVARVREAYKLDQPCFTCRGDRVVLCPRCSGTGKKKHHGVVVRCSQCRGGGKLECSACGGTGIHGVPVTRPRIYVDLALKVTPPQHGQIQFDDVEALLRRLRTRGMWIPVVTADGHESAQFLQRQLRDARVAERLSMDKEKEPYYQLRNAIYDRDAEKLPRLTFYEYGPLLDELYRLEDRPQKIDHPRGGSKDICDAVGGAVYNCERFPILQNFGSRSVLHVSVYGRDGEIEVRDGPRIPDRPGAGADERHGLWS